MAKRSEKSAYRFDLPELMQGDPTIAAIVQAHLLATKPHLTAEEFAVYVSRTPEHVRNLMSQGELPTIKLWESGPGNETFTVRTSPRK